MAQQGVSLPRDRHVTVVVSSCGCRTRGDAIEDGIVSLKGVSFKSEAWLDGLPVASG